MTNQDKLGNDLAKNMELTFAALVGGDPAKVEILKRTKLFRFLKSTNMTQFSSSSKQWEMKTANTDARRKILCTIALKDYLAAGIITEEEHATMQSQLTSPDPADQNMLEMILDIKYKPKMQKLRNKFKLLLNELFKNDLQAGQ
jgi:hypothetical protein